MFTYCCGLKYLPTIANNVFSEYVSYKNTKYFKNSNSSRTVVETCTQDYYSYKSDMTYHILFWSTGTAGGICRDTGNTIYTINCCFPHRLPC